MESVTESVVGRESRRRGCLPEIRTIATAVGVGHQPTLQVVVPHHRELADGRVDNDLGLVHGWAPLRTSICCMSRYCSTGMGWYCTGVPRMSAMASARS